ncbi:hypothetical protein [Arthrobacter sp. NEB 688]|uniref:hypothetical protein n=1 Tax=Arthrobacter sp. NEB 688 TaxID=904039 RepID=UPI001566F0BB|nr:hypothetical protein [Arthrobacter sp. NEB 688]QKE85689.1 hypothetical protein HL663_18355 [Arthrobacter sp. NEB 688]
MSDDTTRPLRTELGLDDDRASASVPGPEPTGPATTPATPTGPTGPALGADDGRTHLETTPAPVEQRWRRGPAPFALILGVLGLVTAGAVIVTEVADVSIPWSDLGPWTVVAGGALVVLVGLLGLRGSRDPRP